MKVIDMSVTTNQSSDSDEDLTESEGVIPQLRRSERKNKGQHNNIHKLPQSVINSEAKLEVFCSAINDLGKLILDAYTSQ